MFIINHANFSVPIGMQLGMLSRLASLRNAQHGDSLSTAPRSAVPHVAQGWLRRRASPSWGDCSNMASVLGTNNGVIYHTVLYPTLLHFRPVVLKLFLLPIRTPKLTLISPRTPI